MTFIKFIIGWVTFNLVGSGLMLICGWVTDQMCEREWQKFANKPEEELFALALSTYEDQTVWPALVTTFGYDRARKFVIDTYLQNCRISMLEKWGA